MQDVDYDRIVTMEEFEEDIEDKLKGIIVILDSLAVAHDAGYSQWDRHSNLILSEMLSNVLKNAEYIKENIQINY